MSLQESAAVWTDNELLEEAIAYYHSLLAGSTRLSSESVAALKGGLTERKLTFGGRPLCTVLRPHFFTRKQFDYVREVCLALTGAMDALGKVILSSDDTQASERARLIEDLALTPEEIRLLKYDTGYKAISAHSRLDSFLSVQDGTLHFVEYNAESPAGAAYEEGLGALFETLPVMQEFAKRFQVSRHLLKDKLLNMLLNNYREYLGDKPYHAPNIAILDWEGVPTYTEFQLLQEHFESRGIKTIIASPTALEYSEGRLRHQGFEIDLVLKRVLGSELLERAAEVQPLIQAYEDGAICMINSFRCKIYHKKMIFGLLTDPANAHYFTPQQQEYITRHIPWTRRVREGLTTYNGQEIDLEKFVMENRSRLVLKPNDEYGGKGISIGWESDEASWKAAWEAALQDPYVVQEKVVVAKEPYPTVQEDMIIFAERSVDCDPYIFEGEVAGTLTRLSAAALLNVTAGTGTTVPTFIIEGRGEGGVRPADPEGCA
ncbi:MAG TPA: hypothetical protein VH186_28685 [Chloroflexia bacterium]|nr:hypothetical protein [Chloroflexia bacterium]